jgi:hypothetical protein
MHARKTSSTRPMPSSQDGPAGVTEGEREVGTSQMSSKSCWKEVARGGPTRHSGPSRRFLECRVSFFCSASFQCTLKLSTHDTCCTPQVEHRSFIPMLKQRPNESGSDVTRAQGMRLTHASSCTHGRAPPAAPHPRNGYKHRTRQEIQPSWQG